MAGIMREKLLIIMLVCVVISLSGCTGISIQIPHLWGPTESTPVPPSESLNAAIIGNTIPDKMTSNQKYKVTITLQNTGYMTWSNDNQTMLTPVDDPANDAILFNNSSFVIGPGNKVKTGSDYTFNISMAAPLGNGNYTLEYRMKDSNNTYFGETLIKNITVGDLNSTVVFLSQGVLWYPPIGSMSIPRATWQNVSITVQNMGRFGWSEDNQVRLAVVDYEPNDATLFDPAVLFHIAPEETVQPGDQCTWKFRLQAPNSPGKYKLEYQMKQGDTWLGKPLIVYITVT